MRVHATLFWFALISMSLSACSGGDEASLPDIKSLFPANNEVGAWVEDTSIGKAGVEVATTNTGIVDLIDGGADPFLKRAYTAFAIEHFTDTTHKLEVRIWQMKTEAVSKDIYSALLTESSTHQGNTWQDLSLGEAGRVANTLTAWWFNTRKGPYFMEATLGYVAGTAPDAASQTAGVTFLNAVLAKMP